MNYYCPKCGEDFTPKDEREPLPVICPECGSDLYPEELVYQEMITGAGLDPVLA